MRFADLMERLLPVALAAGRVQMDFFREGCAVVRKVDDSPVTQADHVSEKIILDALAHIAPAVPVISEEAASMGEFPEVKDRFFLVDPLDGTKEFIAKRDEFTINIALIEEGQAMFGLVYAPAIKEIYVTKGPGEALWGELDPFCQKAEISLIKWRKARARKQPEISPVIIASRSHMTRETEDFLSLHDKASLRQAGSSLKFCLLAKGEADIYPRFGPTMEWDTAAGHAILKAAGGVVLTREGSPLLYGKRERGFRNPYFIASGAGAQGLI